jgi:hypothetical protein
MNPVDKCAIAEFLKSGGSISRIKGSIRVSEPELLEYLASCGITAKYRTGDSKAYLCQGKPVGMSQLITIANEHRQSLELPPFAPRVAIR